MIRLAIAAMLAAQAVAAPQTMFRSGMHWASCARAQCIPLPFRRASTTSLLARSTAPLPMG